MNFDSTEISEPILKGWLELKEKFSDKESLERSVFKAISLSKRPDMKGDEEFIYYIDALVIDKNPVAKQIDDYSLPDHIIQQEYDSIIENYFDSYIVINLWFDDTKLELPGEGEKSLIVDLLLPV